jgi:hypothetical protein
MRYKVQSLADATEMQRHGIRADRVKRVWITVHSKPVRKSVAERISRNFRTDNANAVTRIVEAR